jgi:integrase
MPYLSPPTLTREEQRSLLEASASHPRDHLVFSVALGTGLRLGEIVGLNVGDVYFPNGQPKSRIRLRAEIAKGGRQADVFLPAALVQKLEAIWACKLDLREPLDAASPLFCNQGRRRISRRRVQAVFRAWQVIAGFGRLYPFHALRHTAVTNVYRASRDLFLAQRFARHASPLTTIIYTHVSDEEMFARLGGMEC